MATPSQLTPKRVILRIVSIISLIEFLIMVALSRSSISNHYIHALIDIVLLAALSTPLIYLLAIRPFVLERDIAINTINDLAQTDYLTNLPNRRLLDDYFVKFLARLRRHRYYSALLLIDLNGFKLINDTFGHSAGDAVLVEVANRLIANLRGEDFAGRLGGDEFIVLIDRIECTEEQLKPTVKALTNKISLLIKQPIIYKGQELSVDSSIGIRLLEQSDDNVDRVIKQADIAMYYAKNRGEYLAFYNKSMTI